MPYLMNKGQGKRFWTTGNERQYVAFFDSGVNIVNNPIGVLLLTSPIRGREEMKLLLIFMLVFVSTADAARYYVGKQGADANSCIQAQSVTTPKLTISSGASCLNPGDTLFVRGGLYAEELSNVIP